MKASRVQSPGSRNDYQVKIIENGCENEVAVWQFDLDAAGLGALIISIDRATRESPMSRAIGLKRKRAKPE